jgi:hypothetical protein
MKHLLKRLFGTPSGPNATSGGPTLQDETPLKGAFRLARKQRNIDLILPVFQRTRLFVVAGSERLPDDLNDLFLVPSPGGNGRMCVTVSEQEEWLSKVKWPKRSTTGERLLSVLPPGMEITVVYADGGDFITREHREWYRQLASAQKTA